MVSISFFLLKYYGPINRSPRRPVIYWPYFWELNNDSGRERYFSCIPWQTKQERKMLLLWIWKYIWWAGRWVVFLGKTHWVLAIRTVTVCAGRAFITSFQRGFTCKHIISYNREEFVSHLLPPRLHTAGSQRAPPSSTRPTQVLSLCLLSP